MKILNDRYTNEKKDSIYNYCRQYKSRKIAESEPFYNLSYSVGYSPENNSKYLIMVIVENPKSETTQNELIAQKVLNRIIGSIQE